jgi:hypothetical protein
VDVYAFGIVMWECLELSAPWNNKFVGDIQDAVKSGKRPPVSHDAVHGAPMEYENLMNRCLDQDPERRPPIGIVNTTLVNDVISLEQDGDDDGYNDNSSIPIPQRNQSSINLRARRESLLSSYTKRAANTPACNNSPFSPSTKVVEMSDCDVDIEGECQ